jgi:hypothetical protein
MLCRIQIPVAKSTIAIAALIVAGVAVLVAPICADLFACGCDWPWRGLAERCNYFQQSAAMRCPWCEYRTLGIATPLVATAIGVWAAMRLSFVGTTFRHFRFDWILRGSLGLAVAVALLFVLGQLAFT